MDSENEGLTRIEQAKDAEVINNSASVNTKEGNSDIGGWDILLGLLALTGIGYGTFRTISDYNAEKEKERLHQEEILQRRKQQCKKNETSQNSGGSELIKGAIGIFQKIGEKTKDKIAKDMYRTCHGDIALLRRIARGEHPTANSDAIKAAQWALERENYHW